MLFGKNTNFDKDFLLQNMMGPNCVRILEELTENIEINPDMRILDLACGCGLTSIYLAQEYNTTVFAADLWINPTNNYLRFKKFGLDNKVIPIHTEAHALPFADEYFDAVFCIDAFHYFGADENYLDKHLAPLVKKGGIIAVSIPGLKKEFANGVPEELMPFWQDDINFYTLSWWKSLWQQSDKIEITHSFSHLCHSLAWEEWLESPNPYAVRDIDMMEAEGGKYFDTIGLIAKVK
ncbi:MAG: methyltransferase domain-containing protein [Eubacteriaceae bacterium]